MVDGSPASLRIDNTWSGGWQCRSRVCPCASCRSGPHRARRKEPPSREPPKQPWISGLIREDRSHWQVDYQTCSIAGRCLTCQLATTHARPGLHTSKAPQWMRPSECDHRGARPEEARAPVPLPQPPAQSMTRRGARGRLESHHFVAATSAVTEGLDAKVFARGAVARSKGRMSTPNPSVPFELAPKAPESSLPRAVSSCTDKRGPRRTSRLLSGR